MTGNTYSPDFPTTPGASPRLFQALTQRPDFRNGNESNRNRAGLLHIFRRPNLPMPNLRESIALDGAGNAVVTGYTASSGFPLLIPLQRTIAPDNTEMVVQPT